jgi:hypothetical protein
MIEAREYPIHAWMTHPEQIFSQGYSLLESGQEADDVYVAPDGLRYV